MEGLALFEVKHYHPVKDILGREPEVSQGRGFYVPCRTKTEYGPGLIEKEEIEKLPKAKKNLYETAFTYQSYYCTLCRKRVAYAREIEGGERMLYVLKDKVTVRMVRGVEEEVRFDKTLNEIYGIFADLMGAEVAEEERLLLAAVRDLYQGRLHEAKDGLLALLKRRKPQG